MKTFLRWPMRLRLFLNNGATLLLCSVLSAGAASSPLPADQTLRNEYPGTPVLGLSKHQAEQFEQGQLLFSRIWQTENGLGPHLNANACMTCHHNPLPGGNEFAPARFVAHSASCRDNTGGTACPRFRIQDGKPTPIDFPADAMLRKPQSLFGIGMLEAIPDEALLSLAKKQRSDPDGVRGQVGRTTDGSVGRFGWKAHFANIDEFVTAAFSAEFGMTSERYPIDGSEPHHVVEVDPSIIGSTSSFLRMLAAPPKTPRGDVSRGRALFTALRCTACHVPSIRTGTSPVSLLSRRDVFAYTDMLLHDMGRELADGMAEGGDTGAKFRTPPLWGLNASGPPYLHNGSAASVTQAILLHGGEAARSIERFRALSKEDLDSLLRFLNSL